MLPCRLLPFLLSCAALLVIPASAPAANAVIRDAQDGNVTCKHSIGALRGAQGQISPEEAEYSDIDEAIAAGIAKKRSGGCSITSNPSKEPAIKGKLTGKPERTSRGTYIQPIDTDGDGTTDEKVEVTEEGDIIKRGSPSEFDDDAPVSDDDESTLAANGTKGDGEDAGAGVWLPIGLLLLLAAFGLLSFWRMRRRRSAR
jgi:hypothetical protein